MLAPLPAPPPHRYSQIFHLISSPCLVLCVCVSVLALDPSSLQTMMRERNIFGFVSQTFTLVCGHLLYASRSLLFQLAAQYWEKGAVGGQQIGFHDSVCGGDCSLLVSTCSLLVSLNLSVRCWENVRGDLSSSGTAVGLWKCTSKKQHPGCTALCYTLFLKAIQFFFTISHQINAGREGLHFNHRLNRNIYHQKAVSEVTPCAMP